MLANIAAQEAIAQNLANASTTGYKQDVPRYESFRSLLLDRMSGAAAGGEVGSLGTGVAVQNILTNFGQGALERTGNSLDVAMTGDAYLAIQTPQGVRYTRDGALSRDVTGTLVQSGTHAPVLDTNNSPISIPATTKDISISPQGIVSADGKTLGQLAMVGIDKTSGATKVGDNEFIAAKPHAVTAGDTLQQGYLETSNVNTVREMVAMITAQRTYETNAKMLQVEDSTTSKAVETVASVSA
jgi:flagellar basal-body rod protein FlgG